MDVKRVIKEMIVFYLKKKKQDLDFIMETIIIYAFRVGVSIFYVFCFATEKC